MHCICCTTSSRTSSWPRTSCSSTTRTRTACHCTMDRWTCIGSIQTTQRKQKSTTENGFSLRWQLASIDLCKSSITSIMTHRGRTLDQYNVQELRDLFLDMFCTTKTAVDNPMMQPSGIGQRRSFLVLEEGELEGNDGYGAEDDEEGAEGFLDALEDVFWVYDDADYTWYQRRFQGRQTRQGKGKGRRKGKGKAKEDEGFFLRWREG